MRLLQISGVMALFEFAANFLRQRTASFGKFLQQLNRQRRWILADGAKGDPPNFAVQIFAAEYSRQGMNGLIILDAGENLDCLSGRGRADASAAYEVLQRRESFHVPQEHQLIKYFIKHLGCQLRK